MLSIHSKLSDMGDPFGEKLVVENYEQKKNKEKCSGTKRSPSSSQSAPKKQRTSTEAVTFTNGEGSGLWQTSLVDEWALTGQKYPTATSTPRMDDATGEFVNVDGVFCYKFHTGYTKAHLEKATRMVAFDMDGCVIKVKSGKKFASPGDYTTDWTFWDTSVVPMMRKLYDKGAYLVFISNQNGVGQGKVKWQQVDEKMRAIMASLGFPIDFICSTGTNQFRKPCIAAWQYMQMHRAPNAVQEQSLYVGDAAGRVYAKGQGKDFADSDFKLALNVGVPFQVPEVFFKQWKDRVHNVLPVPSPMTKLSTCPGVPIDPVVYTGGKHEQEVVLLVGPAGSGKSTFARALIEMNNSQGHEYLYVNQDTVNNGKPGKIEQCVELARKSVAVKPTLSVVVDNTNISIGTRDQWKDFASRHSLRVRCIVLETPVEICKLPD